MVLPALVFLGGCVSDSANVNRALTCLAIGGVLGATAGAVAGDEDDGTAIVVPGLAAGIAGAALCGLIVDETGEVAMQEAEREQEMADIGAVDVDREPKITVVKPEEEQVPAPIVQVPDGDGDGVPDAQDRCPDSLPGAQVDDDGCARVGELMAVLRENIHFAFDSARLMDEAKQVLSKVAAALQTNRNISVNVVGHTDSIGTDAYNLRLGERRALVARDYLIELGVEVYQLRVISKGESEPMATNVNASGRAINRRVEFVVNGKKNGH